MLTNGGEWAQPLGCGGGGGKNPGITKRWEQTGETNSPKTTRLEREKERKGRFTTLRKAISWGGVVVVERGRG